MKRTIKYLMVSLLLALTACEPETPLDPDESSKDQNIGTLVFDFPIPVRTADEDGIHRIDLSLAKSAYDLYRGDFLISANVSDRERTYSFKLEPGDYYYQAGITCSCLGDTCLWDGFPGGRYGTKWTMDRITVVKGQKLSKMLTFNQ